MKTIKTISALGLALGLAAAAEAQSIYLTGSTAFRSQVFSALGDMNLAIQQSEPNNATRMTFTGTIADTKSGALHLTHGSVGSTVTVYCSWNGSVEGMTAIIDPRSATYDSVGSGTFSHTGDDLAFSDVDQTVGSPVTANAGLSEVTADDAGNNFGIAIQPFAMVVNANASSIKNITYQNIADLYNGSGTGTLNLNFFTGTATTPVYAVGRYPLSGTHQSMVTDSGYPTFAAFHQWALSSDGSTTPGLESTDTASPPTSGTLSWVDVTTNGYFTGGNVEKAIENGSQPTTLVPAAIAYLGWADAGKLTGTGGDGPINWDGQPAWVGGTFPGTGSWNLAGVENGSYSFWNCEHLYYSSSATSFVSGEFAPDLVNALEYVIKQASPRTAVTLGEMNVYRNGDGGDIYHN